MPEHLHYEEDSVINRETHHESSDVNTRALMIFVVVFIAFAIFTHFVIWFLYKGLVQWERGQAAPALSAIKAPADANVPAQPRLQPFPSKTQEGGVVPPYRNTPVTDMQDMRRAEENHLGGYAWVDQQKGAVRIPIEVAKQLALQRGYTVVAVNAAAAPAPATAQVPAGEASATPGTGAVPPAATAPAAPSAAPTSPAAPGANP